MLRKITNHNLEKPFRVSVRKDVAVCAFITEKLDFWSGEKKKGKSYSRSNCLTCSLSCKFNPFAELLLLFVACSDGKRWLFESPKEYCCCKSGEICALVPADNDSFLLKLSYRLFKAKILF